jgi:hypothetical protein
MKRIILTAVLAATLVGCGTYTPLPPMARPAFPEAEYAALSKIGSATVTGQAFLKTRGGDVKTGAGNTVYITPATSYSTFSYNQRDSYQSIEPADPRLAEYTRETIADGSGRFTFKNLPDGDYFLKARVTWEVPSGGKYSYMQTQGGDLWKRVTVRNGESADVIVTE